MPPPPCATLCARLRPYDAVHAGRGRQACNDPAVVKFRLSSSRCTQHHATCENRFVYELCAESTESTIAATCIKFYVINYDYDVCLPRKASDTFFLAVLPVASPFPIEVIFCAIFQIWTTVANSSLNDVRNLLTSTAKQIAVRIFTINTHTHASINQNGLQDSNRESLQMENSLQAGLLK